VQNTAARYRRGNIPDHCSAIETYYRVKRGVTQIVRVERVEVQPGAQAVIGVVARE
jgi:hypothetical protein